VDPFALPPVAAALAAGYSVVITLVSLLTPIAGPASAAVAIVLLTLVIRLVLIPVGASQVKAEWMRRRLAPKLAELRRRHRKNPALLQQKTLDLYRSEKASPFAGILPTLAQLPVISLFYALFLHPEIGGSANRLLGETLFGVPLGRTFVHLLTSGGWAPDLLPYAAIFVLMAAIAWMSRRTALRLAADTSASPPAAVQLAPALSWMPFLSVVFSAFVPLAAALYLATSSSWTLVERALLRRRYWRED
jgi:YidC/Oxa1 family membrane protein insertase